MRNRRFQILPPPARVRDDRLRFVPLLGTWELRTSSEGPESPRAVLARRLDEAVKSSLNGTGLGITMRALTLGVLVMLGLGLGSWLIPNAPHFVWSALAGAGFAACAMVARADARARIADTLSARAISAGICGSCGYSLDMLRPERDGCVVCPECGAAWSARRITPSATHGLQEPSTPH